MKKTYKFPEGFLWGSGASAEQTEPNGSDNIGNQTQSNWQSHFERNVNKFFEGKYCVNDFWNRYEEDLEIARKLNFNSIRLSISWSRFLPDGINPDPLVIEKYKDIFQTAVDKGLILTINLMHYEMPQFMVEEGGFSNRKSLDWYRNFAREAFKYFGEYATYWATFNEAIGSAMGSHVLGIHPTDAENKYKGLHYAIKAIWHYVMGTAIAVEEFKKIQLNTKAKIGSVFVGSKAIPISNSEEDLRATEIADLLAYKSFYDSAIKGIFPEKLIKFLSDNNAWPEDLIVEGDLEVIKNNTIDFIALNYYEPLRVMADDDKEKESEFGATSMVNRSIFKEDFKLFKFGKNPNARITKGRGREVYPKALYDRLIEIKDLYPGVPVMITENGVSVQDENRLAIDGVIQDHYRIHFISEHLYWIHKAISEGVNVIGYQMWAYIDNWSWTNAYKNRYGIVELDIETGERREKLSASWVRELIKNNEMEFDDGLLDAELDIPDN